MQRFDLAGDGAVIEDRDEGPAQVTALAGGAGVYQRHAAHLLIKGMVRVAEEARLAPCSSAA